MRLFLSVAFVLTFFASFSSAQIDKEEANIIKSDFKSVVVVADVEIKKVEIVDELGTPKTGGGYTLYRFTGTVKESFKGKYKTGDEIIFYSVIEGQPSEESLSKNYIRFLEKSKKKENAGKLFELENSRRPPNKEILAILRTLNK